MDDPNRGQRPNNFMRWRSNHWAAWSRGPYYQTRPGTEWSNDQWSNDQWNSSAWARWAGNGLKYPPPSSSQTGVLPSACPSNWHWGQYDWRQYAWRYTWPQPQYLVCTLVTSGGMSTDESSSSSSSSSRSNSPEPPGSKRPAGEGDNDLEDRVDDQEAQANESEHALRARKTRKTKLRRRRVTRRNLLAKPSQPSEGDASALSSWQVISARGGRSEGRRRIGIIVLAVINACE